VKSFDTPCAPSRFATSLPPCNAVAFSVSVDTAGQCYTAEQWSRG
jgi:hypothetical protein